MARLRSWVVAAVSVTVMSACVEGGPLRDVPVGHIALAETACAEGPTVEGIDVSHWQGSIDWDRVASAGVEFAFMKATQGTDFLDSELQTNWDGARNAGLVRGAYHFFCPSVDGADQAEHFLETVGSLGEGDLPPVLDVEVFQGAGCSWSGVSCSTIISNIHGWVDRVVSETGRTPIIYTNAGTWDGSVCGSTEFSDVHLWVANWEVSCPGMPRAWSEWAFWQTGDDGSVSGVSGGVDTDLFNGDFAALQALAGSSASGPRCGDSTCADDENCSSCADDCGTCERTCEPLGETGGIVDELSPCWIPFGPPRWDDESPEGYDGHLFWVPPSAGPEPLNGATWNLRLSAAGTYRLEAYTEDYGSRPIESARYQVAHAGSVDPFIVDQSATDGWNLIGEIQFAAGEGQYVSLDDVPAYTEERTIVLFDAVRLTRVDPTEPVEDEVVAPPSGGGCCSASRVSGSLHGLCLAVVTLGFLALRRRRWL